MVGETDLKVLLKSMRPEIQEGEYVFCTVSDSLSECLHLNPLASIIEREGLTLVLSKLIANSNNLSFEGSFRQITLSVHSSLNAVGLTAAISQQLTSRGISVNVIAAYYHDHIFVRTEQAAEALDALIELTL